MRQSSANSSESPENDELDLDGPQKMGVVENAEYAQRKNTDRYIIQLGPHAKNSTKTVSIQSK